MPITSTGSHIWQEVPNIGTSRQ